MIRPASRADTSRGVIADLEAGAEAIALLDRSVPFRWASSGVRDVKLETTKAGGIRVTTKAATLRFFARLNGETPTPAARTPKSRERNVARAERELADMGLR